MFIRSSSFRTLAPVLAGLCLGVVAHAQPGLTVNATTASNTSVAVTGLTCSTGGGNSFAVQSFNIGVDSATGTGGGGATRPVFSDLVVKKSFDSCSSALFAAAASGVHFQRLVLTELDKKQPVITVTLDNVTVTSTQLAGVDTTLNPVETVNFGYTAVTITDATGHSTGPISR